MDELETFMFGMENMQDIRMNSALYKITEQHKELTKSISFISEQYEDMKSTIEKLLKEKTNSLKDIQSLEDISNFEFINFHQPWSCVTFLKLTMKNRFII